MIREDKSWENALSLYEFRELKQKVAADPNTKEFKVDNRRKVAKRLKKELVIAGNDTRVKTPYAGPKTELFEGLNFCVLTEMITPFKKTKGAIEEIIRSNGGNIYASASAAEDMLCVGEKRTIPVASLMKAGHKSVIKPAWLLDAIHQSEIDGPERSKFLIPFEPNHMFYIVDQYKETIGGNVDDYGDSYTRDVTPTELKRIMEDMVHIKNFEFDPMQFLTELEERGRGVGELPSEIFRRCVARFVHPDRSAESTDVFLARQHFLFGGGKVADHDDDQGITHFVIATHDPGRVTNLRKMVARRGGRGPRFVGLAWLVDSWGEKTLLDEESYVVMN
jgi:DNA ligase-4